MSIKDERNPDGGHMAYPDPTSEAMPAGSFYSPGRDGEANNHMQDVANSHVSMEHAHQSQLHQQDPDLDPEMQHHNDQHGQPPNLEELQLAAQLGQGLTDAPMMEGPDANMHVDDPDMMHQANGQQEQRHQDQPHDQQQHEQHIEQHHAQHHDQHHDQHQHREQQVEQHHEQPQQQEHQNQHAMPQAQMQPQDQQADSQHYLPDPSTAEALQHGLPVPVAPPMAPHYPMSNDGVPPRKRSKVSRACDECRRKKIKCDATSDSGDPPCTSCGKSNIRCLFSRVPQKRGPSKGYIKELADRIHSIEHKLQNEEGLGHEDLEKLFAQERPHRNGSGTGDESSRKRAFASISGNEYATPTPNNNRQTPWGSEPRATQPGSESFDSYTPSSLAPQPSAMKPDETPSKQPEASMDVSVLGGDAVPEVGADILHDYATLIEPLYPVLPRNRTRLRTLLMQCPSNVWNGFLNAVMAINQPAGTNARLASSLLFDWENSSAKRTMSANIVHAQALILLIIDADWRRSTTLPFLLSRAVALANTMGLYKRPDIDAAAQDDSDEQLRVRIWWTLVLLDRWHAAAYGKPTQIPGWSVVVPSDLGHVVDSGCFYLIRLSKFLSKLPAMMSDLATTPSETEKVAQERMADMLHDDLENFREDLPASVTPQTYPNVHLAYWHCRLLLALLTPSIAPSRLMWPTTELITMLNFEPETRTPLTHHFTSSVLMGMSKLATMEPVMEQTLQMAKEIGEQPGSVWDDVRERLGALTGAPSSDEATASQGLQHLAELATSGNAGGEDGQEDVGQARPRVSLAEGYLDFV